MIKRNKIKRLLLTNISLIIILAIVMPGASMIGSNPDIEIPENSILFDQAKELILSDKALLLYIVDSYSATQYTQGVMEVQVSNLGCSCLEKTLSKYDFLLIYAKDENSNLLDQGFELLESQGYTVLKVDNRFTTRIDELNIKQIRKQEIQSRIKAAQSQDNIVILLIYAPWCSYSQKELEVFQDLEQNPEFENRIHVEYIDGNVHTNLIQEFNIAAYPTIFIFDLEDSSIEHSLRIEGFRDLQFLTSTISNILVVGYEDPAYSKDYDINQMRQNCQDSNSLEFQENNEITITQILEFHKLQSTSCESDISWCLLYDPVVFELARNIRENCDGKLPEIICKNCHGDGDVYPGYEESGGWFDCDENEVVVCEDNVQTRWQRCRTIAHELVHADDSNCTEDCFETCEEIACTEIRASSLSGQCCKGGGWRLPNESYEECVRRSAIWSTTTAGTDCTADDVDAAWDDCYPGAGDEAWPCDVLFPYHFGTAKYIWRQYFSSKGDDYYIINRGCAYVYYKEYNQQNEKVKLFSSDGAIKDKFDQSVAISGNTVLVAADIYDNARGVRPIFFDLPTTADINGDGIVNTEDLLFLLAAQGENGVPADLNNDGIVNTADLLILLGNWTG